MKRIFILLMAIGLSTGCSLAQDGDENRAGDAGQFQLGLRSTMSLFGYEGFVGEGVGGQFRLRFGDRLNSEWFADYITTNVADLGRRVDMHIGWSVMFYPFNTNSSKINPYILAGHCFDYTKVNAFSSLAQDRTDQVQERWSSAIQMGIGTHYYVSKRVDLSLSAQYMQHLGKDIHYEIEEQNGVQNLVINPDGTHEESVGFEGHVFLTLSMNVNIADLW